MYENTKNIFGNIKLAFNKENPVVIICLILIIFSIKYIHRKQHIRNVILLILANVMRSTVYCTFNKCSSGRTVMSSVDWLCHHSGSWRCKTTYLWRSSSIHIFRWTFDTLVNNPSSPRHISPSSWGNSSSKSLWTSSPLMLIVIKHFSHNHCWLTVTVWCGCRNRSWVALMERQTIESLKAWIV